MLHIFGRYKYISGYEFRPSAIRPSVQLVLRANFVQLLQFQIFFSVLISFRLLPSSVVKFILIEKFNR